MSRLPVLAALLLAVGCASSAAVRESPMGQNTLPPSIENLHSALWTATAVEYRATAEQAYRLAGLMLDRALADTSWTAAIEQGPGAGSLKPAVILDVDETVLDNMAYQARMIADKAAFTSESWAAWVEEATATPVPGALDFTRRASAMGVRVVYLTNRSGHGEAATRRNLAALGFPLTDDPDDVLTQNERPEWAASDKGPRRAHVATRHRVLLLVGDNLTDFLSDRRADLAGRDSLYRAYGPWWGERWIMLPNPQYGSWETATFDHDYALGPAERLGRKLALMRRFTGRRQSR